MPAAPIAHTVIALVTLVGCLAVLTVYAWRGQAPPAPILTLIAALATGSNASYLSVRRDAAGRAGAPGQTGPAGQGGPAGASGAITPPPPAGTPAGQ